GRRRQAQGDRGALRQRGPRKPPRRDLGRRRGLAHERSPLQHGAAPAPEPRGARPTADGAQTGRGPRGDPKLRARELGIMLGSYEPGPENAITDVEGMRAGHSTIIEGDDVRTGVTVVVPGELPLFARPFRLNGNGEMTGLEWVRESGLLTTPVAITNTNSVGVVRDALVAAAIDGSNSLWSLPVVGETYDGTLNDINGFHVTAEHLRAALAGARGGAV